MLGALDDRLHSDIRQFGLDAFSLEVLEVVEATADMTPADIQAELSTLEGLWREQQDPRLLY